MVIFRKKSKIKKKKFYGKTQKHKVFISDNINRGVVVYFSGDLGIWDVWDTAGKNTQSLEPKIVFWILNPVNLHMTHWIIQNLVENLFLCFLSNFGVKWSLFDKTKNIFLWWWFFPKKCTIDLSSTIKKWRTIRLAWKFASILSLTRAFKIAMKLDNWWRSFFDLPDS